VGQAHKCRTGLKLSTNTLLKSHQFRNRLIQPPIMVVNAFADMHRPGLCAVPFIEV
jgi:hypothetical protein